MAKVSSRNAHACDLPERDSSGLPKLPPNAVWTKRCCRIFRKYFMLNTNHYLCKQLFRNNTSVLEERKRHATSRYSYVIHPLSSFSIIIEVVFFFTWLYAILFGPLTSWKDTYRFIQVKVMLPIRLMLILLLFNLGYVDDKTKQIVIEPMKIMLRYLRTYFFFDITSCYIVHWVVHNFFIVLPLPVSAKTRNTWLESTIVVRTLAACVRINTLLRFFEGTLANLKCRKVVRTLLIYVFRTLIYVHVFSIFMFMVPHLLNHGNWPEDSWLAQAGIESSSAAKADELYLESFLMTISYFFGISYKYDISILNEQVCLVIVSFCGRIYTLYLLADILRIFGIAGVSESLYERNMFVLQQYMVMKNLPEHLRHRMFKFYEFKFQRRYFKEQEIVNALSENLRTELFLFSARQLVRKVDIFKKLPSVTVGAIVASMKSETYSSKDCIIKLGWEINDIYFVSTGTVAVLDGSMAELCHLEDGDFFAASCLYQKEQPYNVVAVETTEVFIINKDELVQFLLPHTELLSKFHYLVKQHLSKMRNLSEEMKSEKLDTFSQLKQGGILESRIKKLFSE